MRTWLRGFRHGRSGRRRSRPGRRGSGLGRQADRNCGHVAAEDQGLPRKRSSKQMAPLTVGMPIPGFRSHGHRRPPLASRRGMQHSGRQFLDRGVRPSETEDVGVADRSGPHPRVSPRVADHSTESRVGSAVGLEGRGVVVCLDFETDVEGSWKVTIPALSRKTLTHQSSSPSRSRITVVASKMVSLSIWSKCRSVDSSR
ncbi:MAG: hypothetical protein Ct9H300mP1_09160 [Planctomycetaceae bacterium]|nr:MAG: hypothetical protein Ct9H300mP1_09160 [Planctomycetaceae bacterium]